MYILPSNWNGGFPNTALIQGYSDIFGDLHLAQSQSTPPPATAALQADSLYILETLQQATAYLAMGAGTSDPLMGRAHVASGIEGIDSVGSALLEFQGTVDAFLLACDPILVFVFGRGEDWPVGVLPGQVGGTIPAVSCTNFVSQQDAQRFYETAKPDDPHRLDPDGDKRACAP